MDRKTAQKLTAGALRKLYWTIASKEPGKSVGLFAPLPDDLADQFPMGGKEGEDDSPPHLTLLYIGDVDLDREDELRELCAKLAAQLPSMNLDLAAPTTFENDDRQTIIHSPVEGDILHSVHDFLKAAVGETFEIDDKYPEYQPHVTIEYVDEGDDPEFSDVKPTGAWEATSVQLWGMGTNHEIPFSSAAPPVATAASSDLPIPKTKPKSTPDPELLHLQEAWEKYARTFKPKAKAYTTDEYKIVYPYLKELNNRERKNFTAAGEKAMKEIGVEYGDQVEWHAVGSFFDLSIYRGVIVKSKTGPKVRLATPVGGKSSIRWHKGFKKA